MFCAELVHSGNQESKINRLKITVIGDGTTIKTNCNDNKKIVRD